MRALHSSGAPGAQLEAPYKLGITRALLIESQRSGARMQVLWLTLWLGACHVAITLGCCVGCCTHVLELGGARD